MNFQLNRKYAQVNFEEINESDLAFVSGGTSYTTPYYTPSYYIPSHSPSYLPPAPSSGGSGGGSAPAPDADADADIDAEDSETNWFEVADSYDVKSFNHEGRNFTLIDFFDESGDLIHQELYPYHGFISSSSSSPVPTGHSS